MPNASSNESALILQLTEMLGKAHEFKANEAITQIQSAITHLVFLDDIVAKMQNQTKDNKAEIVAIITTYIALWQIAKEKDNPTATEEITAENAFFTEYAALWKLAEENATATPALSEEKAFFTEGHQLLDGRLSLACHHHNIQNWAFARGYLDGDKGIGVHYEEERELASKVMQRYMPKKDKHAFQDLNFDRENRQEELADSGLSARVRLAKNNDPQIVKQIIEEMRDDVLERIGVVVPNVEDNIDIASGEKTPLLHYALKKKDASLLKTVADYCHYTNLNFQNSANDDTTLHVLVEQHYEVEEILWFYNYLQNEKNLLVKNKQGDTFLHALIKDHFYSEVAILDLLYVIFGDDYQNISQETMREWLLSDKEQDAGLLLLVIERSADRIAQYLFEMASRVLVEENDLKVFLQLQQDVARSISTIALQNVNVDILTLLLNSGLMQTLGTAQLDRLSSISPIVLSQKMPTNWEQAQTISLLSYTGYSGAHWHEVYRQWFEKQAFEVKTLEQRFLHNKIARLLTQLSSATPWALAKNQEQPEIAQWQEALAGWQDYINHIGIVAPVEFKAKRIMSDEYIGKISILLGCLVFLSIMAVWMGILIRYIPMQNEAVAVFEAAACQTMGAICASYNGSLPYSDCFPTMHGTHNDEALWKLDCCNNTEPCVTDMHSQTHVLEAPNQNMEHSYVPLLAAVGVVLPLAALVATCLFPAINIALLEEIQKDRIAENNAEQKRVEKLNRFPTIFHPLRAALLALLKAFDEKNIPLSVTAKNTLTRGLDARWTVQLCRTLLTEVTATLREYQREHVYFNSEALLTLPRSVAKAPAVVINIDPVPAVEQPPVQNKRLNALWCCGKNKIDVVDEERRPLLAAQERRRPGFQVN
jgi:hypothetical protein